MGESGCGKSMIALSLLRFVPARPGSSRGESSAGRGPAEEVERGDAEDPGQADRDDPPGPDGLAQPAVHYRRSGGRTDSGPRAREAYNRLDQGTRDAKAVRISSPETGVNEYPHQMSGGMRQRIVSAIAISRAGAADRRRAHHRPGRDHPGPAPGAAPRPAPRIGLALIIITHNLGIVARMCDRVAVMYAGRDRRAGAGAQLFDARLILTPWRCCVDPATRDPGQRLIAIGGQPPDLAAPPPGCRFPPRCPKVSPALPGRGSAEDSARSRATPRAGGSRG